MSKVRKVCLRPPPRVQLRDAQGGRGDGRVAQRLQRRVADVDGVLDGLLPVRVFVPDGREDLVAVVAVYISDVCAKDTVPRKYKEFKR